ncbi:MAG: hypothetical protein KGI71_04730 [Patescibacteria group bacterium]|nr:hypothetical protein [Patescibacteria group bacterium]
MPDPQFTPQTDLHVEPWPGNDEGEARLTRPTMAKFIVEDGDLPEMRERVSSILEAAGWPKTDRAKVEAICAAARVQMHYVSDAPRRESVYRPRYLWCLRGANLCAKIGDCGNMNAALGAALRAAGFDVKVQGIHYGPNVEDHVNLVVYLRDEKKWAEADATVNRPVGYVSSGTKVLCDPLDPKVTGFGVAGGAFVGAGRPWDTAPMLTGYMQAVLGREVGAGANVKGFQVPTNTKGVVTGGGVRVSAFQMVPGHRIRAVVSATSGTLPPEYQQDTEATVNAALAAAGISATVVPGTLAHPTTMSERFEVDYTGPAKTVANPTVDTTTGISTTFEDLGSSRGWSTKKKALVIGGAAVGVALVAGTIYWVLK